VAASGSSSSNNSADSTTASAQTVINADQALNRLREGNKRFVNGKLAHPRRDDARRAELVESQSPFAVVVGCSDSRVPPEIVFDEGIGDLFLVRVAGNTAIDPVLLGSVEYSVAVLGSVLIFVLGHEQCGAVKATLDLVKKGKWPPGHIPSVLDPIVPAVEKVKDQPDDRVLEAAIQQNVRHTVDALRVSTPILSDLVNQGKVKVIGGEYRLRSGQVEIVA
jgi:carbonic anhydrase